MRSALFKAGSLLVVATGLLLSPAAAGARQAATISYEFDDGPEPGVTLPDYFYEPPNVKLRFITIRAIDGFEVKGAYFKPKHSDPASTLAMINVHGSGGNYYYSPTGWLSRRASEAGMAALTISTRQHDSGVNKDNFMDIRKDIEAALYTLKDLGYTKVIIHGQSLGNVHVQFFAATNYDPVIKGVFLTSAFSNLPWKSRHVLTQDEDNYRELYELSLSNLRAGRPAEILPTPMKWLGGQRVPTTAQHFLTYRYTGTSAASGTYWISKIPVPVLMVRDAGDTTVASYEPYELLSNGQADGVLTPSLKFVLMPNPNGPNSQGHSLFQNQDLAVSTLLSWIQEQGF